LSLISQDMRGPLSAIKNNSRRIISEEFGKLSDSARQRLTAIVSSCDRLLALIDELLDLDKLETGQIELFMNEFVATDILQTAIDELNALAQQKGVELRLLENEPESLTGDRSRMVQVCVNLISNAIKFSPSNSTISVYAKGRMMECAFASRMKEGAFRRIK